MTRCQRGKLEASAVKKRVCANQKRLDAFLDECCEGGFDFLFVARINDFDLRPDSRASCRYVLRYGLRIFSIFRVDESGNTSCSEAPIRAASRGVWHSNQIQRGKN